MSDQISCTNATYAGLITTSPSSVSESEGDGNIPPAGFVRVVADCLDSAFSQVDWDAVEVSTESVEQSVDTLDSVVVEKISEGDAVATLQGSDIQLIFDVRQYGVPNRFGAREVLQTNWKLDVFQQLLEGFQDMEILEWLWYGWPINRDVQAPKVPMLVYNHKGATDIPELLDKYIQKELGYNALLGPLTGNPFGSEAGVSPLNTRPRPDEPDRPRVIMDLSYPPGAAVNDGINMELYLGDAFCLTYPMVDDMAARIFHLGSECHVYKRDLKRWFHQIPVDPGDIPFLGFMWRSQLFFCKRLPMGLHSACLIAQRVTNAVSHAMFNKGFWVLNYLDDFPGAEQTLEETRASFVMLKTIFDAIGVEENEEKCVPPTQEFTFFGIGYSMVSMVIFVTPERLCEIRALLDKWKYKAAATRKELESLIGKFQFTAKCVRAGRVDIGHT